MHSWGGFTDRANPIEHLQTTVLDVEKEKQSITQTKLFEKRRKDEHDFCSEKVNKYDARPFLSHYEQSNEIWCKKRFKYDDENDNNKSNNQEPEFEHQISYRKKVNPIIENDPTREYKLPSEERVQKKHRKYKVSGKVTQNELIQQHPGPYKEFHTHRYTDLIIKYSTPEIDPDSLDENGLEKVMNPIDILPLYSSFTKDKIFHVDDETMKNNPFEIVYIFT